MSKWIPADGWLTCNTYCFPPSHGGCYWLISRLGCMVKQPKNCHNDWYVSKRNFTEARQRKTIKYQDLVEACMSNSFSTSLIIRTLEVGSRGFLGFQSYVQRREVQWSTRGYCMKKYKHAYCSSQSYSTSCSSVYSTDSYYAHVRTWGGVLRFTHVHYLRCITRQGFCTLAVHSYWSITDIVLKGFCLLL